MSDFISPVFADQPAALAQRYTAFLYGDKGGNPRFWSDPARWPDAGLVTITDQSVTIELSTGGVHPPFTAGRNMTTVPLNLGKGANAILFSRSAFVSLTPSGGVPADQSVRVPLQSWSYVWIRQQIVEGVTEIGDTALTNLFGTAEQPHVFPEPFMWEGNLKRTISATIPLETEIRATVRLSWKIATLQTGR